MKNFALLFTAPEDLDMNTLILNIQKHNKGINITEIYPDLLEGDKLVQLNCPLNKHCTGIESFNNGHTNFKNLGIHDLEGVSMEEMETILYITAKGSSAEINFLKESKITVSKPLAYYDSLLPKHLFCRVSRYHIINLHKFKKYYNEDGGYIIMEDMQIIHVTDSYRENFLHIIDKLS